MKTYKVNEVFYSLQGEGIRAGTANVFVRFSGCNQTCKQETHDFDCDTEFVSSRALTLEGLWEECLRVTRPTTCVNVIFTGGEPCLQLDDRLIQFFKEMCCYIAVETNGSLPVPKGVDWITVSPKVAEHCIRQPTANEVKYVRRAGQGIPSTKVEAQHYLISPAFDGSHSVGDNIKWCIELVQENPKWQLTLQTHKLLRIA